MQWWIQEGVRKQTWIRHCIRLAPYRIWIEDANANCSKIFKNIAHNSQNAISSGRGHAPSLDQTLSQWTPFLVLKQAYVPPLRLPRVQSRSTSLPCIPTTSESEAPILLHVLHQGNTFGGSYNSSGNCVPFQVHRWCTVWPLWGQKTESDRILHYVAPVHTFCIDQDQVWHARVNACTLPCRIDTWDD